MSLLRPPTFGSRAVGTGYFLEEFLQGVLIHKISSFWLFSRNIGGKREERKAPLHYFLQLEGLGSREGNGQKNDVLDVGWMQGMDEMDM